jgi:acyl dehydratase
MAPKKINGPDELKAAVGEEIGLSDWVEISQDQVNLFADATGDHQWIHVDPEKAKSGPFGGPIAHGYLTMSLAGGLVPKAIDVSGFSMVVNYGIDKLRFPAPVPVGSKLRVRVVLAAVDEVKNGLQTTLHLTFEVDGSDKPACVADVLYRWF